MECDELIEQILKERLAALVASGKCSQYFGENYTTEKFDNMSDEEIKKLYVRY